MPDRFHVNSELAPGHVLIDGPEAHHMAHVCRVHPGDAVCLFNGDGREYLGSVVEVSRRQVGVEVHSVAKPEREVPFELHLAVPLPKGDRAQFLVEKLTELGVTVLTILSTRRSVVQPREAKLEKLERHVIEASKQCGRNVLMRIEGPTPWSAFLQQTSHYANRLLAHPVQGAQARPWPAGALPVVAAVGPEGGFTEEEVAEALASGWVRVDLGPRILRMETAAMVLAARLGAAGLSS